MAPRLRLARSNLILSAAALQCNPPPLGGHYFVCFWVSISHNNESPRKQVMDVSDKSRHEEWNKNSHCCEMTRRKPQPPAASCRLLQIYPKHFHFSLISYSQNTQKMPNHTNIQRPIIPIAKKESFFEQTHVQKRNCMPRRCNTPFGQQTV